MIWKRQLGIGAAAGVLLATLGPVPACADEHEPVDAGIFVEKVDGLSADFINGVDVSSVLSLEESGVVFRDAGGNPADLFDVLADHGITDVRIRVWNDPFDAEGRGYGGGNVGVDRAVEIGERATDAGLRVLVDFHYSDFWADPARWQAPKAWAAFTVEEKADAVGEFTTDALQSFEDAGVDVRMVQIGNETNNGIAGVSGASLTGDLDDVSLLFSAGAAAVRDVLPDALVALHFTNPDHANRYANAAAALDELGVDYDVFASSYYPFWHGSLENLTNVLSQVATTYDKQVMVVETSWVHTFEQGDGWVNTIDQPGEATAYPVSVQGQATAVRDVIQAVADVGNAGIGVYYWEPAWLPVGPPDHYDANALLWEEFGSGWATSYAAEYDPVDAGVWYGGSSWENQALFAYDGTPLESLRVFEYARTGAVAPLAVVDVEHVFVNVDEGDPVVLPATVAVTYNDGTVEQQAVEWPASVAWITGAGSYPITGTTEAGLSVDATITVLVRNFLLNPGFEHPDLSMWASTGSGLTVRGTDTPRSGTYSSHFWQGSPYSFTLSQSVTGLPAGSYVATASVQGGDQGAGTITLTLTADGDTASAPVTVAGWQAWQEPLTGALDIPVSGSAVVTIAASLPAGGWGSIDNVVLALATEPGADTTALEAALADAQAIDRTLYTEESLRGLDDAIAIAEVVLAADRPQADTVAEAIALLDAARAALVLIVPEGSLSVTTVGRGGSLTVSATGFQPVDTIEVWIHSTPRLLASGVVASDGSFVSSVTVPASVPSGHHEIEIRGAATGSVWLDVKVQGRCKAGSPAQDRGQGSPWCSSE
jgi:arabinogalactan endo-1,4-beta-galactosidase